MQVNYIRIYKDECESDSIFEQYCKLSDAIIDYDGESVVFYTINEKDIPDELKAHK